MLRRSSAAVATSQEGQRSPRSGPVGGPRDRAGYADAAAAGRDSVAETEPFSAAHCFTRRSYIEIIGELALSAFSGQLGPDPKIDGFSEQAVVLGTAAAAFFQEEFLPWCHTPRNHEPD